MCGEQSSEDHDDGNDESVQSNGLSENEDKDHSNEDSIGLGVGSDAGVAGNTNCEASSEGAESASKSSSEVHVSILLWHGVSLALDLGSGNDGNDNTINTQNTSHNNWNQALEDLSWFDHGQRRDADSGLSSTIGSSKISEDESRGNTNIREEERCFYKRTKY